MHKTLLVAALAGAACSSGYQPVHVPPSAPSTPVGSCVRVQLQSEWDGRSPTPPSGVRATCADPKVCEAKVSTIRAGLVYARGVGVGSTALEMDFRDPATGRSEHKTTRVTFSQPTPGAVAVHDCDDALRAR